MRFMMFQKRNIWIIAAVFLISGQAFGADAFPDEQSGSGKVWSVELRVENYFAAHTSYEFGNPFPPYQAPLSRLEFPLDTWWVGFEARRRFPRFSAGIEVMRNFTREAEGLMKDSDWTDDAHPGVRTIYSESNCRMDPSYTVRADADLKIADWIGLPSYLDIRPVVGFRWQRFNLVAHDGTQWEVGMPDLPLPGDVIAFTQTYRQYFLGLRADYDIGRHLGIPRLRLQGQCDWARVDGKNEDQHLTYLQLGIKRFTYENTSGHAWHGALALKYGFTPAWSAKLEADYLKIKTTGSHLWHVDNGFSVQEQSWENGVKVWSEQLSINLGLEYAF